MMESYLDKDYRQLFRNLNYPERVKTFDSKKFVEYAEKIGASSICVDTHSQCYSNYNTEFYTKDPLLGEKDLIEELSNACCGVELKFCCYIAPLSFEALADRHPEWNQANATGNKAASSHWKSYGCWNTGFGEFICDILAEISRKYSPDGFYIDGPTMAADACRCPCCLEKFQKETGYPMPLKKDWKSREWINNARWRARQLGEFGKMVCDVVHAVDPRISVIFNSPYAWCNWLGGQSCYNGKNFEITSVEIYPEVAAKFPEKIPLSLMQSTLYLIHASKVLSEGGNCQAYTYITPDIPEAEAAVEINSALAAGTFLSIQGCVPYMDKLMKRIKETENFLSSAEEIKNSAVLFSDTTCNINYKDESFEFFTRQRALFRVLAEDHIPVQFFGDNQLENGRLDGFSFLLVDNAVALSKKASESLKKYVNDGGIVLATLKTGLLDEYGKADSELLWDGAGIKFINDIKTEKPRWVNENGTPQDNIPSVPNIKINFDEEQIKEYNLDLSYADDGAGWADHEIPGYPVGQLHLGSDAIIVDMDDSWQIIQKLSYKIKPEDNESFTAGLAIKNFGKGKIYFLNCDLGQLFRESDNLNWKKYLKSLFKKIQNKQLLECEAPSCIYFSVWEMKNKKQLLVQLVNELSSTGTPSGRTKMRTDVIPVEANLKINIPFESVRQVVGNAILSINENQLSLKGITERSILVIEKSIEGG